MPLTRIKICGFTRAEDVRAAVALGIDALGFNLARGPRRITAEQARALAAPLPPFTSAVALFVDADEAAILEAMRVSRCGVVQLHGAEPPELAARLRTRFPVIKAFSVGCAADLDRVRGYPADAYLLDAQVPGLVGGTGVAWDHRWLAGQDLGAPVILAGGLHAGNVAAAIAIARPWAVDTASGVEGAPALKDAARMAAFAAAVRG
jgi:phosphoribosylanthranilate isomerase